MNPYIILQIESDYVQNQCLGFSEDSNGFDSPGVSRGKGQDLFLQSFNESLQLIREKKLQLPSIYAVIVGSDMSAQTRFETELRDFVAKSGIEGSVRFVNKSLNVAPYLAAIDVLVQNSQVSVECFLKGDLS